MLAKSDPPQKTVSGQKQKRELLIPFEAFIKPSPALPLLLGNTYYEMKRRR
ncbi:hypothetical protein PG_0354 [Porphyromonas gingivalis W83]|uniref:Uncharacterized protein n=1 Tax=Porphyromonas gingivalis (strain ATCC BAA-308 / W83) TaxID=242619 RepID=Q7MX61_PORGI|nr:hypothetical protein PG_0354 [Porphyromonas gingivalis W83]